MSAAFLSAAWVVARRRHNDIENNNIEQNNDIDTSICKRICIVVAVLVSAVILLIPLILSIKKDLLRLSLPSIEFKVISLDVIFNNTVLESDLNLTLLLTTTPRRILFKPLSVSLEYQNVTLSMSKFEQFYAYDKATTRSIIAVTILPLEMHVTASQMKNDTTFYSFFKDLGNKQSLEFEVIILSKYWIATYAQKEYDETFNCKVVVDKLPGQRNYTLGSGLIACK